MKKIIFSIFPLILILSIFYLKKDPIKNEAVLQEETNKIERSIASIDKNINRVKTQKKKPVREISGMKSDIYRSSKENIKHTNKVSADWEDHLKLKLLKAQEDETTLAIVHNKSILLIKKQKARYTEVVTVNFKMPKGKRSSYKALVDSQTGVIIKTWGHSKNERRDRIEMTATNL